MQKKSLAKPNTDLKTKIILIICGFFLFFILLEIGLRLGGLVLLSIQEYKNLHAMKQKGTYRIMCLGESTTAMGGESSYPSQLEKILNQRGLGIKVSIINMGVSGVTTSYILAHLQKNLGYYNPNMVVTMMGIGDGALIIYRDIPGGKNLLGFGPLRICRLADLLWLHVVAKFKEMGLSHVLNLPRKDNNRAALLVRAKAEDDSTGILCKNTNTEKSEVLETKRLNYREAKRIVDKRGIRLVCVQYPMLGIESLKEMFKDMDGVVLVDNENIFKEAVKRDGYKEYFSDMFAGDFGHCTPKGNQLLAENIANVIIKEIFCK